MSSAIAGTSGNATASTRRHVRLPPATGFHLRAFSERPSCTRDAAAIQRGSQSRLTNGRASVPHSKPGSTRSILTARGTRNGGWRICAADYIGGSGRHPGQQNAEQQNADEDNQHHDAFAKRKRK